MVDLSVYLGGKEILYWGYNWNNRGFIRYTSLFHLNKYVFRLIKVILCTLSRCVLRHLIISLILLQSCTSLRIKSKILVLEHVLLYFWMVILILIKKWEIVFLLVIMIMYKYC